MGRPDPNDADLDGVPDAVDNCPSVKNENQNPNGCGARDSVIRVWHLSKSYGAAPAGRGPALDDVSFEVGKGEVVGLLGPNGAGKTTMMRILTCFLAPTRGGAELAGHPIAGDTRAVRRAVGYLPEAVPLYPEMRVAEYLTSGPRSRG